MCQIVVTKDSGAPIVVIGQYENADIGDLTVRLREARRLLGLKQSEMAAWGGVSLNTQNRYEGGTTPSVEYLMRIGEAGADWYWIVTGQRIADALTPEESRLIDCFRLIGPTERAAILAVITCMPIDQSSAAAGRIAPVTPNAPDADGSGVTKNDEQSNHQGEEE